MPHLIDPPASFDRQVITELSRAATGVAGLDEILNGGLPCNHLYLLDGSPGTGKTTLALQFLLEGVRQGEQGLYVTLSESREELEGVAASHGWTLDGIEVFELASQSPAGYDEDYTIFHPAEVELQQTIDAVIVLYRTASFRRCSSPSCRLVATLLLHTVAQGWVFRSAATLRAGWAVSSWQPARSGRARLLC